MKTILRIALIVGLLIGVPLGLVALLHWSDTHPVKVVKP
jgi:hypothetical protein